MWSCDCVTETKDSFNRRLFFMNLVHISMDLVLLVFDKILVSSRDVWTTHMNSKLAINVIFNFKLNITHYAIFNTKRH